MKASDGNLQYIERTVVQIKHDSSITVDEGFSTFEVRKGIPQPHGERRREGEREREKERKRGRERERECVWCLCVCVQEIEC